MPKQVVVIQVLDFQNMEKGMVTLVTLEKGIVTPAVKIEKIKQVKNWRPCED